MKKKKKIVYLISQHLDKRNYDRFGIEIMANNGWVVEVWDLTYLVNSTYSKNFFKFNSIYDFSGYRKIRSIGKLYRMVKNSSDTFCGIFLLNGGFLEFYLKWMFKFYRIYCLSLMCGMIPSPKSENHHKISFVDLVKIKIGNPKDLISKTSKLLISYALPKMDFIVTGGLLAYRIGLKKSKTVINAHSMDYDIYLSKSKDKTANLFEAYGVFLDNDEPFHSDYIVLKLKAPVSSFNYFSSLNTFFTILSEKISTQIMVAVHPRANVDHYRNRFSEDVVVRKKETSSLVKNAKFVISHSTTSTQFAVLYRKPILFIATNEQKVAWKGLRFGRISAFADELGRKVVNIDQNILNIDWQQQLNLDENKYSKFIQKYVKMDATLDIPIWEIVDRKLSHIYIKNTKQK